MMDWCVLRVKLSFGGTAWRLRKKKRKKERDPREDRQPTAKWTFSWLATTKQNWEGCNKHLQMSTLPEKLRGKN